MKTSRLLKIVADELNVEAMKRFDSSEQLLNEGNRNAAMQDGTVAKVLASLTLVIGRTAAVAAVSDNEAQQLTEKAATP